MILSFLLRISEVRSLKSIYLVDQWSIRRRNWQARSVRCSYGSQVETSLSSYRHTYTHLGTGSERKGRPEKFVKVGYTLLLCNGRLFTHERNFHIPEK